MPGGVGAAPGVGAAGGLAGKATIGSTTFVKGDLSGDEDVVIAGQFEGAIDLPNHTLTIIESGQVRANIQAAVVVVQGEATGDVVGVTKVVVVRTGRVRGNIKSPSVIIDDGAVFNGSIDMDMPGAAGADGVAGSGARRGGAAAGERGNAGKEAGGDASRGVGGAPQSAQPRPAS